MSIVELPARWEPDGERTIAPEDWARYERYLGEIFAAFGMDLGTPGTKETPKRFLRAVFDATTGYDGDAKLYKLAQSHQETTTGMFLVSAKKDANHFTLLQAG